MSKVSQSGQRTSFLAEVQFYYFFLNSLDSQWYRRWRPDDLQGSRSGRGAEMGPNPSFGCDARLCWKLGPERAASRPPLSTQQTNTPVRETAPRSTKTAHVQVPVGAAGRGWPKRIASSLESGPGTRPPALNKSGHVPTRPTSTCIHKGPPH